MYCTFVSLHLDLRQSNKILRHLLRPVLFPTQHASARRLVSLEFSHRAEIFLLTQLHVSAVDRWGNFAGLLTVIFFHGTVEASAPDVR